MAKRDYYEDHEELLKMLNARDARVAELEQEVARLNLRVNDLEAVAIQLQQLFNEYPHGVMPWYQGQGYERSILANAAAALAAKEVGSG